MKAVKVNLGTAADYVAQAERFDRLCAQLYLPYAVTVKFGVRRTSKPTNALKSLVTDQAKGWVTAQTATRRKAFVDAIAEARAFMHNMATTNRRVAAVLAAQTEGNTSANADNEEEE